MDNPTQGIDVGAKAEIYGLIQELAKNGKTILVNTLEIPEIQKIADRCIVFYHGQIEAELSRDEISEEQVMAQRCEAALADLGVSIPVRAPMNSLSVGQQQMIEIAKALME